MLQLTVSGEFLNLPLIGQKIKCQLFLHLLQLQKIELGFIKRLLQLLLQGLDLGLQCIGHLLKLAIARGMEMLLPQGVSKLETADPNLNEV